MSEQPKSVSTRSKFHIPNSTLFAMGYVDLIFTLKLTNKDLLKPEGEQINPMKIKNQMIDIITLKILIQ